MLKASVITPPPKKRERKEKQSRQEAIEESLKIVRKMLNSSQLMAPGQGKGVVWGRVGVGKDPDIPNDHWELDHALMSIWATQIVLGVFWGGGGEGLKGRPGRKGK